MINPDEIICLGRIYFPVKTLGPGNRVGIWMIGCDRHCEGCISPEWQIYDSSKEVSVSDIIGMIKMIPGNIDGFTISGGEPFYKPEALSLLVDELSEISDDILIFTGYTIEELKTLEWADKILEKCAALIDGPYIKDLNDGKGLKGSSNQRCHIFRYPERYSGIESQMRMLQPVLYDNNMVSIGIP